MTAKCWLSSAAGAVAMSLWALPAQAASIPGSTASLKAAAHAETMVEGTHWRRRYGYHYGGYYPSYSYPRYRYYSYSYPSYSYYAYPSYGYSYGYRHHHHHHRYYRGW